MGPRISPFFYSMISTSHSYSIKLLHNATPANHTMPCHANIHFCPTASSHAGCSYARLITLENCSILTFSLSTVLLASFSLFRGTLTTVPLICHPQTLVTNLLNCSPCMPSHDSSTDLSTSRTVCDIVRAIRTRISSSKPATSAIRSA